MRVHKHMDYKDFLYDFYVASPFFNPEQVEREEALKKILREKGYRIFSPKENVFLSKNASNEEQQKAFNENLEAINKSFYIFAITDGKDMGTVWECGYAYAIGKPIVYFCETLPENGVFNLMLARSAHAVYIDRADIVTSVDIRQPRKYGGYIE